MKQLQHFKKALQQMQSDGITHKTLRNQYHMTRWGARKFTDILPTQIEEEEVNPNIPNRKIYYLNKPFADLDRETLHTQIPVTVNNTELTRETRKSKQSQTKEMNDYLARLEKTVKQVEAPEIRWVEEPETSENGVDLIFHDTDAHFGSLVENKHGETVFDSEIARKRYRLQTDKFMDYAAKKSIDHGVDTIHWLLGGDTVEGTGIYDGQAHEVDQYINEQIETATEQLTRTMKTLVKACKVLEADLQIVCIPGNHGKHRGKGSSNKANYDDLVYYNLQHATNIYLENPDTGTANVRFQRSDTVVEDTFPLRGGRYTGYLCHGQHLKPHVGTSSGQKDALSIANQYDADIVFRGHYHMPKIEDVNGLPVVMTNSIKPGGPHEKGLQAYGEPGYAFYTVSDGDVLADVRFGTF